jgi:hypothetical protein
MPSDTKLGSAKQGPILSEQVQEVQAIFPSDATLQEAIGRLTRAGFDRAAISLPATNPPAKDATPSAGAENPNTEDDAQQSRTLHSSMAGAVGALAAAGATIATGGAAALALAAAAGAGLVTGGAVSVVHRAVDAAQSDAREDAAQAGQLVLAVNVSSPEDTSLAEAAMHEAGASRVERVDRTGADIT